MRSTSYPRSALFLVLVLGTALLFTGCGGGDEVAKPSRFKEYGKGYRFTSNGWNYLHIEGGPYERGYQHGRLMAPEIAEALRTARYINYLGTGKKWEFFVEEGAELFRPKLPPEYLEEITGIADGAIAAGVRTSVDEMMMWNGSIELLGYWWPNAQAGKYGEGGRCSAFIATGSYTDGGKVVMAHNTWDRYVSAQSCNLLLDLVPARGHRVFMQSVPGYIHSAADFFVTGAGLMGTETTMGGYGSYDLDGTPEFIRARTAMQYADGMDGFVEVMRRDNNGGYANSWLLGDARSGEILRFEQGLEYDSVERTKDGFYVGFNGATDPEIRNLECSDTGYYNVKDSVGARRVRLTQLMTMNRGEIDTGVAEKIMADHYDVYLDRADSPGVRTVEGRGDVDPRSYTGGTAFSPAGAVDGKVMDSEMAGELQMVARWGSSSGMPFDAKEFLKEHIQFADQAGYLKSRPTEPWTVFKAGQK